MKNGIIKNKYNMRDVLSVIAVCTISFSALATGRVVVPQLPPSPYDDTEMSTNAVMCDVSLADNRFSLSIELDAGTNNCLMVEFGADSNSNNSQSVVVWAMRLKACPTRLSWNRSVLS